MTKTTENLCLTYQHVCTATDFPKGSQNTCLERQIFKGGIGCQIFEKIFNNHINFYGSVKIKEKLFTGIFAPLHLDSEHYAIQLAVIYLQEIVKFYLLFRILKIGGAKIRCRYEENFEEWLCAVI